MSSLTASSLNSRVYGIVADVLNVPISNVGPDSSPETVESWDSVHHLNLILAFEQAFHLQLEPEEIDQMNGVKQILVVLNQKLNPEA
jgi:acyl carrier protein